MNNFEAEHHHAGDEPWQTVVPAVFSAEQPTRQTLNTWALVLDSRSIPCCLENRDNRLCLTVPPELHATAQHELERFQQDNQDWPPLLPATRTIKTSTLATVSTLLLLATFHNLIHLENSFNTTLSMPDWTHLGRAQAALIRDGEWWRTITALTLHADWTHLSGNLAIGGIFIFFLCREVGTGLAWFAILAAGTIGNYANAWLQNPSHSSVGASTAVFGAVGILAAIGMVHYRHHTRKRWQMPIAAALALLGILGTEGKNTDIGAHLFGFTAGIGLGLAVAITTSRIGLPGKGLNALFALASAVLVGIAWWSALAAP